MIGAIVLAVFLVAFWIGHEIGRARGWLAAVTSLYPPNAVADPGFDTGSDSTIP